VLFDVWLDVSLPLRLLLLFAFGLALGGQVNHLIYRLAHHSRPISPWQRRAASAPPRTWFDRLPLLGWWTLRRERDLHGPWFWLRPLLIELGFAAGLVLLYWWETERLALIPRTFAAAPGLPYRVHAQFLAHGILFFLMAVASFIDFDERLIPDEITVSGMLLGLVLVSLWPLLHLPTTERTPDEIMYLTTLKVMRPVAGLAVRRARPDAGGRAADAVAVGAAG
jgi:leader peptidase (prepilin peptidase) / N-methyltransferase